MKLAISSVIAALLLCGCGDRAEISLSKLEFVLVESGKHVNLSEFEGNVIVLEFWATWCGPCHQIAPFVQELYNSRKGQQFVLYGISNESRELVAAFRKNSRLTYPVGVDFRERLHNAFGVDKYPTMVILGKDGKVLFNDHPGKQKEVLAAISSALD